MTLMKQRDSGVCSKWRVQQEACEKNIFDKSNHTVQLCFILVKYLWYAFKSFNIINSQESVI